MNDSRVVKSRWRYTIKSNRASALLAALGVEYRKVAGKDFWEANREQLPYLYRELQTEARLKMRELHPDTGGNASEFDAFIQLYSTVKKRFVREGLLTLTTQEQRESSVLAVPAGTFRNPARALELMRLIQRGLSDHEVARTAHAARGVIRKARKLMNGAVPLCGCGKPPTHKGWCATKLARYPRRAQFLATEIQKLPQNISGRPQPNSAEHRHKISAALTGKAKSIEHAGYCRVAAVGVVFTEEQRAHLRNKQRERRRRERERAGAFQSHCSLITP